MRVRCIVPRCKVSIKAISSVDRLWKFRAHFVNKHPDIRPLGIDRLTDLVIMAERNQELSQDDFLEWLAEG